MLLPLSIMLGNGIVKLRTSRRFVSSSNYQVWVSTATAATTPSVALVRRTASAASSSTSASAGRGSSLSRTSGEIQYLAQVQIFKCHYTIINKYLTSYRRSNRKEQRLLVCGPRLYWDPSCPRSYVPGYLHGPPAVLQVGNIKFDTEIDTILMVE